jgi:hypothetical protein
VGHLPQESELKTEIFETLSKVGFSHEVSKRTIPICCSTALEELPFDVKTWKTISYDKGQTHSLKGKLVKALKEVLNR